MDHPARQPSADVALTASSATEVDCRSRTITPPARGTTVWLRQRRWILERATFERGILRLDLAHRHRQQTFLAPFDRPCFLSQSVRPKHVRRRRALARCAAAIVRQPSFRLPIALLDARLDILPHQIEPALAVLSGRRRVLIADDVGLGKTIQAALVVAEIARRQASIRVLVLVPAALRMQWLAELTERFHLHAELADPDGVGERARYGLWGANPWSGPGVRLASVDYVRQPHVLAALPLAPWDLVVIDEAHHVCGDTARHDACSAIGRAARHLILLTATPHSGDDARFQRLLDLGRLTASDDLTVLRRTREDVGIHRTARVRWRAITFLRRIVESSTRSPSSSERCSRRPSHPVAMGRRSSCRSFASERSRR